MDFLFKKKRPAAAKYRVDDIEFDDPSELDSTDLSQQQIHIISIAMDQQVYQRMGKKPVKSAFELQIDRARFFYHASSMVAYKNSGIGEPHAGHMTNQFTVLANLLELSDTQIVCKYNMRALKYVHCVKKNSRFLSARWKREKAGLWSAGFAVTSVSIFIVTSIFSNGVFDKDVAAKFLSLNQSDCQWIVLVLNIVALLFSLASYTVLIYYDILLRGPVLPPMQEYPTNSAMLMESGESYLDGEVKSPMAN